MICRSSADSWTHGRLLAAASILVVSLTPLSRGDQVVTATDNYLGARVISFEGGRLRFRGSDGTLRHVWPNELSLLILDRGTPFEDFNQAERFLAGAEPERAVVRYRRALGVSDGFWTDLILARATQACDAAGQLDKATTHLIRLLQTRFAGPPAAARLFPTNIPSQRDGKVVRAVEHIDAALRKVPDEDQKVLLELLRYEILRRSGDRRAQRSAQRAAVLTIPPKAQSPHTFSVLLDAMKSTFEFNAATESLTALDGAIRDCPPSLLPGFLLLKGQTLLGMASTREDLIRAAWAFMRVPIHFRDNALAPEGLRRAALTLERIGRVDKAVDLLKECLGHKLVTTDTRRSAEKTLLRLQATVDSTD
jgi:hypothetical protein